MIARSAGDADGGSSTISPQEFRSFLKQLNGECAQAMEKFESRKAEAARRSRVSTASHRQSSGRTPSPAGVPASPPSPTKPAGTWTKRAARIYEEKRNAWEARRRQLCGEPEPILETAKSVRLDGPPAWGMQFAGLDSGERVLRPDASEPVPHHQEPLVWEQTLSWLRKTVPESFRQDVRTELWRPLSPPQLPRMRVLQACPFLGGGQQQSLSARIQQGPARPGVAANSPRRSEAVTAPPQPSAVALQTTQKKAAAEAMSLGWILCAEGGMLALGGRAVFRRAVAAAHVRGDGPEKVNVPTNSPLERMAWRKTQWCTMIGKPLPTGPCVLGERGGSGGGCRGYVVEVELAEDCPDGTRPHLHLGFTTGSAFRSAKRVLDVAPSGGIPFAKDVMEACKTALNQGWLVSTNGHRYSNGVLQQPGGGSPLEPPRSGSAIRFDDAEQRPSLVEWPLRFRPRPLRGGRSVRTIRLAVHPDGSLELEVESERVFQTDPGLVPVNVCRYEALVPLVGSGRNVVTVEFKTSF